MSEPFKIAAVQAASVFLDRDAHRRREGPLMRLIAGRLAGTAFVFGGMLGLPGCSPDEGAPSDAPEATSGPTVDVASSRSVAIEYIAHAAFLITGPEGTSLLVDPYESRWWLGYDFPSLEANPTAALLSHPHPDHDAGYEAGRNVPWGAGTAVLTSPGQYEFDELSVRGVRGKHADPYGEEFVQRNTIWLIEAAGIRIAHVGDNGPVSDEIVDALGRVDILMIPVDDLEHILTHDEVAEWRARLSPRVMIPMHYRHDDLEIDPESPGDLASIEEWLSHQIDFGRLAEHRISLTPEDLPTAPRIWVFPHSPRVVPPR